MKTFKIEVSGKTQADVEGALEEASRLIGLGFLMAPYQSDEDEDAGFSFDSDGEYEEEDEDHTESESFYLEQPE